MSLEKIVFRDTEVFKGLRFLTDKIRDKQTHFKPTETFQFTHFSSGHPISVKKGFVKGEALRLLKQTHKSWFAVKNEGRTQKIKTICLQF